MYLHFVQYTIYMDQRQVCQRYLFFKKNNRNLLLRCCCFCCCCCCECCFIVDVVVNVTTLCVQSHLKFHYKIRCDFYLILFIKKYTPFENKFNIITCKSYKWLKSSCLLLFLEKLDTYYNTYPCIDCSGYSRTYSCCNVCKLLNGKVRGTIKWL